MDKITGASVDERGLVSEAASETGRAGNVAIFHVAGEPAIRAHRIAGGYARGKFGCGHVVTAVELLPVCA